MNKKGFGLIELVISAAIMMILFLAYAQMASQQAKFIRGVELTVTWIELQFDILSSLNHLQSCSNALKNQTMISTPTEVVFVDQANISIAKDAIYNNLKILHVQTSVVQVLSPTQVVGNIYVSIQKLGQFTGPPVVNKSFTAQFSIVPGSPDQVSGCF